MLSRALAFVLAAALAVALLLAGGQQAALAGGGPGGVNPYGNVTCGQSYAPQCQVTAGTGQSAPRPRAAPAPRRAPSRRPGPPPGAGRWAAARAR